MRKMRALITILVSCGTVLAGEAIVETRTIRDSLTLDGGAGTARLTVDNVFGSIRIEGGDGTAIEFEASETIEARTPQDRDQARQAVSLQVTRDANGATLYVDGPFRCKDESPHRCDQRRKYHVRYDFVIRVPRQIDLELSTVNDGEIEVADVRGAYDVANVNGGVRLMHIDGSGDVTTVNGEIEVIFDGNPSEASRFTTVNGTLDAAFQPDLSADLEMKTMNGEIRSHFEVAPLALAEPETRSVGDRTVIQMDHWTRVRIAQGGPRLTFETLNGDVLIRNALRQ